MHSEYKIIRAENLGDLIKSVNEVLSMGGWEVIGSFESFTYNFDSHYEFSYHQVLAKRVEAKS